MHTILFPTDFSENAYQALVFALKIAAKQQAKLILMNAFPIPYDFASKVLEELEYSKKRSLEKLQALAKSIRENPDFENLDIDILSLPGDGVSVIKATARSQHADLIVMGAKGASGLQRFLFGNITADTILFSNIPVLTVPIHAKFENMNRIIYAAAYDEKDIQHLRETAAFAKLFDAEIHVLHVAEKQSVREEALFRGFREMVKEHDIYHKIQHNLLINQDFMAGIQSYAKECDGSLVVMSSQKKSFLQQLLNLSHSQEMLYHTKVPLLVLKS
ncbi:UspA domain protein [Chloroherpeton thalassium ATCC 35110]|uniref:UspA domain protein n=1 Tax=Chloroherpeton thalassium (strain ATCC 35110 / GB-78) TaxID=517418 RepID=B3QTG9_CHLT3|nr:universal stress protein [Chloroherpeton thalassium]ACF12715.1 UspA domain protein [Chloroherpeton thalassium ATCC 35110]